MENLFMSVGGKSCLSFALSVERGLPVRGMCFDDVPLGNRFTVLDPVLIVRGIFSNLLPCVLHSSVKPSLTWMPDSSICWDIALQALVFKCGLKHGVVRPCPNDVPKQS